MHDANSYVTLTFDDEHLAADRGLHVEDWQRFAKRLRKRKGRFRFFQCGEYGEQNLRPHYHALLFGLDFRDKVPVQVSKGRTMYASDQLASIWGQGHVTVGPVTFESAAYVARYVLKKVTGPNAERAYKRRDVVTGRTWSVRSEFVTMSRRPGIGSAWFAKFRGDVYPADEVVHRGRRFRPPRFYDEKLSEEELGELKRKRLSAVREHLEDLTPERLGVREKVAGARLSNLRRDL